MRSEKHSKLIGLNIQRVSLILKSDDPKLGSSESELLQYRSSVRFSSKDHFKASLILIQHIAGLIFIPPPNEVGGVILESPWPSVCLSVCPSVCRRHGFRSVTKVFFGISISNFICMLFVAIGRSLLIFSDVTFKMAAWWPYWIFRFPDSNFSLALKSSPNFTGTSLVCMERSLLIFSNVTFKMAAWWPYWICQHLNSVVGIVSGA